MNQAPWWDVVVIGGGPAGAAAAATAARRGLRVVLLEAARFPRERPGETLHPGTGVVLRSLGVEPASLAGPHGRYAGIQVTWAGRRRFVPLGRDGGGPWRGYHIAGARLDARLLARARGCGVSVVREAARRALVRHGAVVGVEGDRACYPAAVTIDASGRRHWLARQLGLAVQPYSRRLTARYGYVRGRGPRAAPSLTADPTGWTWLARIGPDLHHWTRLDIAARAPAPVLPPDLRGLAARGRPRAADVTWRAVDRLAGPGYFLAGDAGVVVDPAGGHGVLRALMSGVLAASAAGAGLGGGPARQGAGVYRDWLLGWFHRDVVGLARRYRQAGWI